MPQQRWSRGRTLVCLYCGARNDDPGGDPLLYRCGNCGRTNTLRRVPKREPTKDEKQVAGAAIGAVLGAAVGGAPGAVLGGILGALLGGSR